MYNVNRGPSKIVTQARIGVTSHLERDPLYDGGKKSKEIDMYNDELMSTSKPVYIQLNGKKLNIKSYDTLSTEHKEIIKYVSERWQLVNSKQCKMCKNCLEHSDCRSVVYFKNEDENEKLRDFTPFDLDSWWGRYLYETITESVQ